MSESDDIVPKDIADAGSSPGPTGLDPTGTGFVAPEDWMGGSPLSPFPQDGIEDETWNSQEERERTIKKVKKLIQQAAEPDQDQDEKEKSERLRQELLVIQMANYQRILNLQEIELDKRTRAMIADVDLSGFPAVKGMIITVKDGTGKIMQTAGSIKFYGKDMSPQEAEIMAKLLLAQSNEITLFGKNPQLIKELAAMIWAINPEAVLKQKKLGGFNKAIIDKDAEMQQMIAIAKQHLDKTDREQPAVADELLDALKNQGEPIQVDWTTASQKDIEEYLRKASEAVIPKLDSKAVPDDMKDTPKVVAGALQTLQNVVRTKEFREDKEFRKEFGDLIDSYHSILPRNDSSFIKDVTIRQMKNMAIDIHHSIIELGRKHGLNREVFASNKPEATKKGSSPNARADTLATGRRPQQPSAPSAPRGQ